MPAIAVNPMKNDRYNLLLAISLFLLIVVLFSGWGIFRKSQLDSGSQQLAITAMQTIFPANNGQFLAANAHQEYLLQMPGESFDNYISSTQFILGPLTSIESISGSSDASFIPFRGTSATAGYQVDLIFVNGEAVVDVAMSYQQGNWQFTDFIIQSPALIE